MSAAIYLARGVVIPLRIFRSCDLLQSKVKSQKLRKWPVSNCTILANKHRITMSSIGHLLETYDNSPPTAKVAFKTGVYITGLGLALLLFPQAVIQFFSTLTR